MAIVFPHTFEDGPGHTASGVQVMDNLNALKTAIEGVGESQVQTDAFQAGVVASTDWIGYTLSVNSSTGALSSSTPAGGAAWLPAPVGGLVRTYTAPATFSGLIPPVLPGAGGYLAVGWELEAAGGSASLHLVSGPEKGSAAEAIAAPAPTTSGRMRFLDYVMLNTAGVYSLPVVGRDRRPWAKGFYAYQRRESGSVYSTESSTPAPIDATNLSMRAECSGKPMRFEITCIPETSTSAVGVIDLLVDGAAAVLTPGNKPILVADAATPPIQNTATFGLTWVPSAGSHLLRPAMTKTAGTGPFKINNALGVGVIEWSVQEILRPSANNGTA